MIRKPSDRACRADGYLLILESPTCLKDGPERHAVLTQIALRSLYCNLLYSGQYRQMSVEILFSSWKLPKRNP